MTTPEDLTAIAALTDQVRRNAYRAVAEARPAPIGRDEVAGALGIGRSLAAFHLDKLVDAGLLEVSYARRSGRTGPGAGRPAKLYHLSAAEHAVSVPPRSYRTAASLLAEALDRIGGDEAVEKVAREHGRRAGLAALDSYEPDYADERVVLRNCPFHQLAEQFPPLICGMNLALVSGLVEGSEWEARMDAAPGRCCVILSKKQSD
ncbi:transcriptional regulator [Actinoplanes sp. NPDC023714]|uniref:helix-turn-helix transcriptional regulator n=1 Tax=Actinoplanes sp. NPDC023714 TaxID=3154322 RepID=UPI0033ED6938